MTTNACTSSFAPIRPDTPGYDKSDMCQPGSPTSLHCFSSPITTGINLNPKQVMQFCEAKSNIVYADNKFQLGCEYKGVVDWPCCWADTGLCKIKNNFLNFVTNEGSSASTCTHEVTEPTILWLRENRRGNVWHTLTEVVELARTADSLDIEWSAARVIILDDVSYYPADTMVSTLVPLDQVMRVKDLAEGTCFSHIVLAPCGMHSPLYNLAYSTGLTTCKDNHYLQAFAHLAMASHGLADPDGTLGEQFTVLMVNRQRKRRLVNFREVRASMQEVFRELNMEDKAKVVVHSFENNTLQEQMAYTRNTNIMVGVHGAGLTHALFLPGDSVLIEFIPPCLAQTRGVPTFYRNLARVNNNLYLSMYGEEVWTEEDPKCTGGGRGSWTRTDLRIDPVKFKDVFKAAVLLQMNAYNNTLPA